MFFLNYLINGMTKLEKPYSIIENSRDVGVTLIKMNINN